jgi:hypothetical protein
MSIVNRRNAVLGWVVWTAATRALERSAKAKGARGEVEDKRAKKAEPEEGGGGRRLAGAAIALVAAIGVGVATYARTRGSRRRGETLDASQ